MFEAGILIFATLRILCQNKCWTFPRESSLSIFCLYNIYFVVFAWKLMASKTSCTFFYPKISAPKCSPKCRDSTNRFVSHNKITSFCRGAFGEPAKAQVLVSNENQLRPNVPLLALKGRKVPTAVGARHMQKTRKATLETLRKTMGNWKVTKPKQHHNISCGGSHNSKKKSRNKDS